MKNSHLLNTIVSICDAMPSASKNTDKEASNRHIIQQLQNQIFTSKTWLKNVNTSAKTTDKIAVIDANSGIAYGFYVFGKEVQDQFYSELEMVLDYNEKEDTANLLKLVFITHPQGTEILANCLGQKFIDTLLNIHHLEIEFLAIEMQ